MGHGNGINLCEGRVGFGQGPVSDCSDALGVGPSRDFWDHTAIGFVQLVLRLHHRSENAVSIFDHRNRGFIATGFKAQHPHG